MRSARAFLAFLLVLAVPSWARAGDGGIAISGVGITSATLTPADLAKFPATEMDVSFMTKNGVEKGHYKGVLLWSLLQEKGLSKLSQNHHEDLQHTFLVTAEDGYRIAFSIGEIAPDFGNRAILIATERDGKPLAPDEGLRLVVPGDARGARSVKGVVSIEVK
ncbi:molybdopterin-dependent oxidoreductase [Rhizobiales bacterium 3FA27D7]|jgi:DMSO/TMAO reductase YedYZ molybdopterin-dependent catalytic subunit|uniref:molybdopterin-dependent oxidoreductase n=1 Tax=Mesorhizobium sp. 2RAF21 TaxID=3232995 RepID=UPI0010F47754